MKIANTRYGIIQKLQLKIQKLQVKIQKLQVKIQKLQVKILKLQVKIQKLQVKIQIHAACVISLHNFKCHMGFTV